MTKKIVAYKAFNADFTCRDFQAAATGDSGHAAATGRWGVACSLGVNGHAKGAKGNFLVLAHYNDDLELQDVWVAIGA